MLYRVFLLLLLFSLTGCTLMQHDQLSGQSRPYSRTAECAEVAWDVGAMRYKKYSDECPAVIGWISLCGLPFIALGETAVLPARAIQSQRE